jgi:hypothetical protein
MPIVKAIRPDGKVEETYQVDLTPSGMLIRITDDRMHQTFIHRLAWEKVIKAVQECFDQEKAQSEAWLAEHGEDNP